METPEGRVRHWTSLMSLQPQERYFSHLCDSLLFVKAWMIWIYSWLSFKLISLWGTCIQEKNYPLEKYDWKGRSETVPIYIWWIPDLCTVLGSKPALIFSPDRKLICISFTYVGIWLYLFSAEKISMLIHHHAALGILTNNAAKCFLNATNTKANVLLSYKTSHNSKCIPESSPFCYFVCITLTALFLY